MSETMILSFIVGLIYTGLTGLSPGGIIMPFYFVINMEEPIKIVATLISSLICILIVKGLSRFTILYGRRRFVVYLIVGILVKILATYLMYGNNYMFYQLSVTIGYVVTGLLARDMERQGIFKTWISLFIVVFIVKLGMLLF